MASPSILDIEYSRVGSVDSNYYGVNVLDSASLLLDGDNDKKSYSFDENFLTFPNSLTIHEITGSPTIVSGGGEEPPAPVAAERWE